MTLLQFEAYKESEDYIVREDFFCIDSIEQDLQFAKDYLYDDSNQGSSFISAWESAKAAMAQLHTSFQSFQMSSESNGNLRYGNIFLRELYPTSQHCVIFSSER